MGDVERVARITAIWDQLPEFSPPVREAVMRRAGIVSYELNDATVSKLQVVHWITQGILIDQVRVGADPFFGRPEVRLPKESDPEVSEEGFIEWARAYRGLTEHQCRRALELAGLEVAILIARQHGTSHPHPYRWDPSADQWVRP